MKDRQGELLPERNIYLWLLAAAPSIWLTYFLAAYVTASIWCAKAAGYGGSLNGIRGVLVWYTVAALIGILLIGWSGVQRYRLALPAEPYDADTPEDRQQFLAAATMLLAGLSAIATIMVALSLMFARTCY